MGGDQLKTTTINTGKSWCERIEGPNHLKAKVSSDDGRAPHEMLDRASRAIAALTDDFLDCLDRDIAKLRATARALVGPAAERQAAVLTLYQISHDLKGQGRTFGYDLISTVAHSLCRLLERTPVDEPRLAAAVATHIGTLTLVRSRDISGDGGPLGQELTTALAGEVEVVGNSPPAAPRLTGGNRLGITIPGLSGARRADQPAADGE